MYLILAFLVALIGLAAFFILTGKAEPDHGWELEQTGEQGAAEPSPERQGFTVDWIAEAADGDWSWPNTPLTPEPPFDWKKERLPELGL